jgi:hypothetical protein
MRRLLLSSALLLHLVTPAGGSQIPPGCSTSGVGVDLQKSATNIHNGDTVTYSGSIDNSAAANVCDAAAVIVKAFCPDAQGQPTILNKVLFTSENLPHATPLTPVGSYACVINLGTGVTTAIARVTLTALLHDNPVVDDLISVSKDLSVLLEVAPPPPPPPVSTIPTMSEWSFIALAGFIIAMGALALRRRRVSR